jgi:hypothetical protein
MLFYESAACLHGRRQVFKGKYYASVFSHYQPVDRTIWNFTTEVTFTPSAPPAPAYYPYLPTQNCCRC